MAEADPFNLQRFVDAQAPVINRVRQELLDGRKASHWMWFVFPQIEGLGFSSMAIRFAISSCAEAVAYLAHPILGSRVRDLTAVVNGVPGRSAYEIFGSPDDLKFRSCLTLFNRVTPDEALFRQALEQYFGGQGDPATLDRLRGATA